MAWKYGHISHHRHAGPAGGCPPQRS
jgi:hypothetical protein